MISIQDRFFKFVVKKGPNDCWLWSGVKDTSGYGKFSLYAKRVGSHRFSYELATNQKIPSGMVVMHKCDNPSCVNPNHLTIGTFSDNAIDMVKKNRSRICFLTEKQVKAIKSSNLSVKDLSKSFEVSTSCIRDIKKKRTWKHIE